MTPSFARRDTRRESFLRLRVFFLQSASQNRPEISDGGSIATNLWLIITNERTTISKIRGKRVYERAMNYKFSLHALVYITTIHQQPMKPNQGTDPFLSRISPKERAHLRNQDLLSLFFFFWICGRSCFPFHIQSLLLLAASCCQPIPIDLLHPQYRCHPHGLAPGPVSAQRMPPPHADPETWPKSDCRCSGAFRVECPESDCRHSKCATAPVDRSEDCRSRPSVGAERYPTW